MNELNVNHNWVKIIISNDYSRYSWQLEKIEHLEKRKGEIIPLCRKQLTEVDPVSIMDVETNVLWSTLCESSLVLCHHKSGFKMWLRAIPRTENTLLHTSNAVDFSELANVLALCVYLFHWKVTVSIGLTLLKSKRCQFINSPSDLKILRTLKIKGNYLHSSWQIYM